MVTKMAAPKDEKRIPCHVCGKTFKTLKRCKNCRITFYCSRECQIKDWTVHKQQCFLGKTSSKQIEEQQEEINSNLDLGEMMDTNDKYRTTITEASLLTQRQRDVGTGITSSVLYTSAKGSSPCDDLKERISPPSGSFRAPDECCKDPVTITVKTGKQKHQLLLDRLATGERLLGDIASQVRIPLSKMKLIHRGKVLTSETIASCLVPRAVFQAIGEVAEDEEGLRSTDIECVMDRIRVDRNTAIKALRATGDVIDAILYLGNK